MKTIIRSSVFDKWVKKLRDTRAKSSIYSRVTRLAEGNSGDVTPIGEGCSEMRIHYGPGYRVYFKDTGREIIVLLCGGDKSSQREDIQKAKELARLQTEEIK
jgi:putative addiction module killer protein